MPCILCRVTHLIWSFLDIWIPGIDGMQTLKAIKRINPDCSVVMMSGHGTIETAVKAIKFGATDYLEKPLNLEDVLHLVHRAVAERSSDQEIARRVTASGARNFYRDFREGRNAPPRSRECRERAAARSGCQAKEEQGKSSLPGQFTFCRAKTGQAL